VSGDSRRQFGVALPLACVSLLVGVGSVADNVAKRVGFFSRMQWNVFV